MQSNTHLQTSEPPLEGNSDHTWLEFRVDLDTAPGEQLGVRCLSHRNFNRDQMTPGNQNRQPSDPHYPVSKINSINDNIVWLIYPTHKQAQ